MKQSKTQHQKAINDGYLLIFYFQDGNVHCPLHPTKGCPIYKAKPDPRPCIDTGTIVYRLEILGGLKGVVILVFDQDEESQHFLIR